MATADDSKLTGTELFDGGESSDGLLRRNTGATPESRHLISEAFSFLADPQDCILKETDSVGKAENCGVQLRRNSQTVRENRHFISDAFSFLRDSQADAQDDLTEAAENQEQVYSNVGVSSEQKCFNSEHKSVYSNGRGQEKYKESGAEGYVNFSPRMLQTEVAKNQERFTYNCKSKDSGFASLERGHVSDLEGGERLGLMPAEVNGLFSDDEDEEDDHREEMNEQEAVLYENQVPGAHCLNYVNGTIVQAASTSSSVLNRNASENLYDDLNLSTTSNQSETLVVQSSSLIDGGENAIAIAAENFGGAGDKALTKKAGDIIRVSGFKSCSSSNAGPGNTEKLDLDVKKSAENAYDTFICIDFNKVDLSSGKPILKTGASYVINAPEVKEDGKCSNYDEITEYLTPSVQQGGVISQAKFDSDNDEDDDTEDQVEQSPKINGDVNQAYEYDTITFLGYEKADGAETTKDLSSTMKIDEMVTITDTATLAKVRKEEGSAIPAKACEKKKSGASEADLDTVSQSSSVETTDRGDLNSLDAVVTRKPRLERNLSVEIGSDDSSDEDIGIYAESFRRSNWIRVSEEGKLKFKVPNKTSTNKSTTSSNSPSSSRSSTSSSLSSKSSTPGSANALQIISSVSGSGRLENLEDIIEDAAPVSPKDDVFIDPLSESLRRQRLMHKRSDSNTTTASESEFKHHYVSRRKCLIQRADSQQEYHRLSARVYDQDKQVIVQRAANDDDLGLHLLDSHPAFITSVDPGSPADLAGIQEGQILVSVNDLNVLTTDHADIVKLIQSSEGSVRLGVATSDFQPVRDLQAAAMSGFMYKLGNSSFVRTWKKRYFILRQDNCLYYYKSDQDNHDPLGAVPLCGYTILRHTETSKDFCFKAEKYGARTYFFMTDNRDQLTDWVRALTEAAARSKRRKESFLSVSSHNVGLPALDIRRPECSGNLTKLKPTNRSWCKRYCVLKDACMYYYKDVNSLRAIGVAHLHGYKVDSENHPKKKHSFSLQPPETSMRSFHFAADNETDKKRWVETLIHSIQRWVRVEKEADC
ncbi:pleckstrin-like protein domain-containing family A member 6 [Elysia marginata]|uniref:Pleckstrin-like protein domain-containing family A member 6 n=1 Tax=Elysia marginata TaxID=1093978 RepID=A0AAV4IYK8_9GAST|nr:pleckstrin-like protein domain-containing family A member 6 [Elysia marginata]